MIRAMKHILHLTLWAGMAVLLTGCAASSFYGDWNISKQLENAPLGDLADGDLGRIIGSTLSFSASQASCFGDAVDTLGETVANPEYITMDYPAENLESGMGCSLASLGGSGSTVKQVAVVRDSERNTGIVMYVINQDTLVVNGAGTFFLLERRK